MLKNLITPSLAKANRVTKQVLGAKRFQPNKNFCSNLQDANKAKLLKEFIESNKKITGVLDYWRFYPQKEAHGRILSQEFKEKNVNSVYAYPSSLLEPVKTGDEVEFYLQEQNGKAVAVHLKRTSNSIQRNVVASSESKPVEDAKQNNGTVLTENQKQQLNAELTKTDPTVHDTTGPSKVTKSNVAETEASTAAVHKTTEPAQQASSWKREASISITATDRGGSTSAKLPQPSTDPVATPKAENSVICASQTSTPTEITKDTTVPITMEKAAGPTPEIKGKPSQPVEASKTIERVSTTTEIHPTSTAPVAPPTAVPKPPQVPKKTEASPQLPPKNPVKPYVQTMKPETPSFHQQKKPDTTTKMYYQKQFQTIKPNQPPPRPQQRPQFGPQQQQQPKK